MSETQNQENDLFNVSDIFNKRNNPTAGTEAKEEAGKEPAENSEKVQKLEKKAMPDKVEANNEDDNEDAKKPLESKGREPDHAQELEKLRKRFDDTQRLFHEDRKKLSAYKKAIEKLKAEGTLLDEEASLLLDHTRFDNDADQEADEPLLIKYGKIWDKEIEYMRKYSTNVEDINQSIHAFQHLIQSCSDKERQEIIDDLSQYEDNEVELTKQMIEMGRQYNDEIYSDIQKAGNIRNLKSILYKREEELQKKVDKLQKQYDNLKKKYEDYDAEPGGRIPSGSSNNNLQKEDADFDVSKIFANRYKRR